MSKRVLVACEFSGTVRDAFRARGYDAFSADILPTEGDPDFHYEGDVMHILENGWDLMIAHPPCTFLANSGVRWLHEQEGRWEKMYNALEFWHALAHAPIERICIENPIQHKYAKRVTGQQSQLIQPWQYGHGETKATCLWLKNLPLLEPTDIVAGREARVHRMPPGPERQKERSRFFTGIAAAMADQWGPLL